MLIAYYVQPYLITYLTNRNFKQNHGTDIPNLFLLQKSNPIVYAFTIFVFRYHQMNNEDSSIVKINELPAKVFSFSTSLSNYCECSSLCLTVIIWPLIPPPPCHYYLFSSTTYSPYCLSIGNQPPTTNHRAPTLPPL